MTELIKGLDISAIQGMVDFDYLAKDSIKFCIMRCGVGNEYIDKNYLHNIQAAKSSGILTACYHFIYPLVPSPAQPLRDPIKQAQFHFEASKGELACIDCEWPAPEDFKKWGCTSTQINQWMLTYLAEYERLNGKKPIVYTYPYWAKAVQFDSQFAQYPLWIASYVATPIIPAPWTDWALWQDTGGTQHLHNGVAVDTDKAKDLSLWGVLATPEKVAPPAATVNVEPIVAPIPDPTPLTVQPSVPSGDTAGTIISILNSLLALVKSIFSR